MRSWHAFGMLARKPHWWASKLARTPRLRAGTHSTRFCKLHSMHSFPNKCKSQSAVISSIIVEIITFQLLSLLWILILILKRKSSRKQLSALSLVKLIGIIEYVNRKRDLIPCVIIPLYNRTIRIDFKIANKLGKVFEQVCSNLKSFTSKTSVYIELEKNKLIFWFRKILPSDVLCCWRR